MSGRAYRAARPVPRRRTTARPASRIRWDRVGRVALVLVLGAVLASYLNPLVNFVSDWQGSEDAKANLAKLEREHDALKARVSALSNPHVLELEARRQGMIAPGERSYVIHGLPH